MASKDWPERIENDPRWEVQPSINDEDDPGGLGRAVVVAALVMAVFVAILAWMVTSTPTPA